MYNQPSPLTRGFLLPLLVSLLAIILTACATDSAHKSVAGTSTGELVVGRSFALAGLPVALMIDGRQVTTIPFNRKYHASLSAGWHTLGVRQIPNSRRTRTGDVRLLIEKGKTYELTATKVGPEVMLQQNRS